MDSVHTDISLTRPLTLSGQYTDITTSRSHSTGTDDSTVPHHAIKDKVVR